MKSKIASLFIKLTIVTGLLCLGSPRSFGQNTSDSIAQSKKIDSAIMVWLKDLYEPGVKVIGDSMRIDKEAERLLNDKEYRNEMYPKAYTWEAAIGFIQKQEIKKASWFFLNLFLTSDKNKELVVKSILTYDKIFKMDRILVSSYHTYSFTDPEIGTIEDGNSKITAPHIMEKKLNALKAMLFYLDKYKPTDRKENTRN
jgi:hypothetical protein